MIYYFCGHKGSGKTYLANQITNELPIEMIDTGPLIRKIYKEHNRRNLSFGDWMNYYEQKHGENFSNELICRASKINSKKNYIIIGFRSLPGIKYFNRFFNTDNYKIIYLDGDYELFKNNYNNREKTNISIEQYEEMAEAEDITGIEEIKDFAKNNSQYGEYYYKKQNDNSIYEDLVENIKKSLKETER